MKHAAQRSLSLVRNTRGTGVLAVFAALLLSSFYCGQAAANAHGKALATPDRLGATALSLGLDSSAAANPFGVTPFNAPPTSSPYAQAVLSDSPAIYYRLDETGGPVAHDSSGNEYEGGYQEGVTYGVQGAIAGDPSDNAINATGLAITQSGTKLPAGNSARTMEFWVRGGRQNPIAFTYGGEGGTNDQFRVTLYGGELWLTVDSSHGYASAQYALSLPQAWWDGNWHLFDVTYDGTKALGYMDGQLVGSFGVRTPLATATGTSPLRLGDRAEVVGSNGPYDLDEFAIYPAALTPEQIDSHWSLGGSAAAVCATPPTSPYGQSVLKDSPSLYFRLGDPGNDPTHHVAYDASGHCNASAPTNASYTGGVTSVQGATLGDTDNGIAASGVAVTQSGVTLPSGNSARSMEFWVRGGRQNPIAFTYGGAGGTNDQFRVTVYGGELWLTVDSSHGYASAQYALSLPQAWWDGNWHLFDVTYDGIKALGYMDGQLVGSFGALTPIATVTGTSPLRIGDRAEVVGSNGPYSLDEFAIYPIALTSEQIDAHWTAQSATPPGMSVIAGTALIGGGGGAQGVRVQACPASGGPCTVDPYPVDEFGFFHFLVPNGTYTVTIFAPAGSPDGPKTIGPLVLPPSALHLSATFGAPGSLPEGVAFNGQEHVVPSVFWGNPSTMTVKGCTGGLGVLYIQATNTSTGQSETRASQFVETPMGSGTYVAQIPPLAPLHGTGSLDPQIACPGHTHVLPDGGPQSTGTSTLLGGSGFTGATEVMFGSSPASSFTVANDNLITATAPAGTGSVPVTVKSASGGTLSVGTFSYFDVTGIAPTVGPSTGGTTVTITGHGFNNVQAVMFGVLPAPSFTVVSEGEIQAQAPIGIGTVDVQVVNGFAVSHPSPNAQYAYQGGPPGSAGVSEPTTSGGGAPSNYASQVLTLCAQQDCSGLGYGTVSTAASEETTPVPSSASDPSAPPLWNDDDTWGAGWAAIGVGTTLICLAGGPPTVALCAVVVITATIGGVVASWFRSHHICLIPCDVKIDPSGTVVDTKGNPIEGATATLLDQSLTDEPFTPVAPSSGAIEPAENPEKTGTSGQFDWNALAGTYEVEASAPGCHAAGESSQPNVFTSPFVLPPPAVGLMLTLECPGGTAPTPKVTGLSVPGGSTAGGNAVDILGEGLADVTSVHFGANASVHVQPLSPYAVVAVAPAGTNGTVDVTVSGLGGTSATAEGDHYTYSAPSVTANSPVVESVAPSSGPLSGGTVVTITGSHLAGAFLVEFGGTSSTQVTPISGNEVRAVAPAAAFPERVDVTVTTSSGGSAPTLADTFTYGSPPPPVATGVTLTPSESVAARGQTVTLKSTVAPTDGGGSVAFYADGSTTPLGNCGAQALTLNGSAYQASCSTSSLALGSHALSATYSGDASYAGSSGGANVSITRNAEEEAKIKTEEEAKKKAEEDAVRKQGEEEAAIAKKHEEEATAAAAKKHQEEEATAKAKAEGEAKAAAEARARAEAEAAAKKKAEEVKGPVTHKPSITKCKLVRVTVKHSKKTKTMRVCPKPKKHSMGKKKHGH
jgi:Concanavalin A-like lectin/glucanases superfamily/Bacterial Ig-like domain (group 3)/IPT/TIG domain